jgi:DNA-binding transcriptional ArsR family regulator
VDPVIEKSQSPSLRSRDVERREATADEARALANPLRLRILRLCLGDPLTNKEIAARLGRDPGSTLHHVRMLVETGFLAAEPVRRGAKGAIEKPNRATGKSWQLEVSDADAAVVVQQHLAMVDALRDELHEAGPDAVILLSRFANRLTDASRTELVDRLEALIEEYALRDEPGGTRYAFLVGGHVRPPAVSERDGPAAPGR